MIDRRSLIGAGLGIGAAGVIGPLEAQTVDLNFAGGGGVRPLTDLFPGKRGMILQRMRPPLLETPMPVFDQGVFTPNDRFFVRWHWAAIPTDVDAAAFRLGVRGHVARPMHFTLDQLLHRLPRVELAAVNQCSGNSRGYFEPRVPGAQWGNGAMGNALWAGVRLRDVLDAAGVKAGATAVRFTALDEALAEGAPRFRKSLAIDHARDGEVMLAFAMNGAQLPLLHGFPIRLIVPGYYSTYWVKSVDDIEVLAAPDDDYWMAKAYRIPATPGANVAPGATGYATGYATVPIGRMNPRSFVTNVADGQGVPRGRPLALRGIALGGASGVARVDLSTDGGRNWAPCVLGPDEGRYGFRRWSTTLPPPGGPVTVAVRCTNSAGETQGTTPIWNPGGFMRNVVERITVRPA